MEISKELVQAYADFFGIDLSDGTQEPGIIGTLTMWYQGKGELAGDLVDNNPLFDELKASYIANQNIAPEKLPEETPNET